MNKHRWIGLVALVLVGHVLVDVPSAHAQTPVPHPAAPQLPAPKPAAPLPPLSAPKAGEVSSDPIRCWWKADRTAVRVGERFGLVLTCSVIETGPITVVPVLNQLEPGAL